MNARFCSMGKLLPYLIYFSILMILLWCWKPAAAQTSSNLIGPVKIGYKVPDVAIQHVLRYQTASAKISDFKGKVLILDFWATWCKPCVSMIPRMDSLEKRFAGQLVLLPVTYQTEKEVMVFREKYAERKGLRIDTPEVILDEQLRKLFPHEGVPHYVWIDPQGILRAVTGWEEINAVKIQAFLNDHNISMAVKADQKELGYDGMKTQLLDFIAPQRAESFGKMRYHSFSTAYMAGLHGLVILKQPGDSVDRWRVTFTNITPFHLYSMAYGEGKRFIAKHSVSIQTKDSLKFVSGLKGAALRDWIPKNTLCYELVVPASLAGNAFNIFQDDLRQLFPAYEALIETKTRKVLALVRTSQMEKFKSKTNVFSERYQNFAYHLRHSSMEVFVMGLENHYMARSPWPLVNQTGYEGKIDLDLELDFSDIDSVKKALAPYDLTLEEKFLDMPVLVIKDRIMQASASSTY
ncbi:TlpA family protein disulfide reductase [Dyadobacter subterraneus]|uniref:Redoxin domain-containing protein n=1 Tax=Dyadobacter subterraneus TaxID=2773304 RepID=A0ABR9WAW9_9BACT|nr:TlpA family protein disulfide reductase [Dyadobacter subterraneus]MBE9462121.1 redoxin domain-containing protein [Dyadobacter subterraneus]